VAERLSETPSRELGAGTRSRRNKTSHPRHDFHERGISNLCIKCININLAKSANAEGKCECASKLLLTFYMRRRDPKKTSPKRCLKSLLFMGLSRRYLELLSRRPAWSTPAFRCAGISNSRSITTGRLACLPRTPLFEAIKSHDPESSAVIHSLSGRQFSYESLLTDVAIAKQRLANDAGRDADALQGERIAFLVENSYDYVGALCPRLLVSFFLFSIFSPFLAI
jgi:hypothetical protein